MNFFLAVSLTDVATGVICENIDEEFGCFEKNLFKVRITFLFEKKRGGRMVESGERGCLLVQQNSVYDLISCLLFLYGQPRGNKLFDKINC